jgi:hypothetical protein
MKNLDTYDLLVYFPLSFVPEPDGLRQDGMAYNSCIDAIIRSKLPQPSFFGNSCLHLAYASPEVRASKIVSEIKKITPLFWKAP